uniref:Mucin like 1 n=1 Tax=Pan paniscus TaxID=9597 RepID=A0A2R9B595_PANPA
MKFLAVLVLLGVSIFLVSAQNPTTAAPADTYPATGPADDEAPDAETTVAATTATTTAATTATTANKATSFILCRSPLTIFFSLVGDLLNGRVCP